MAELTDIQTIVLPMVVGFVAFLYSSVGHGGATGYLAAAALLGLSAAVARPGALWMNCCVAGIAFWRFQRAGFFDVRIFVPLAVASIPCAWLGSRMHLEGRGYALVLGAALLAAGWFLGWGRREHETSTRRPIGLPIALLAGGGLGFLAGLTGIGGGVFLTPLLIFLNWTPAKVAGGISALFIVVNSIAGLAGLGGKALVWQPMFIGAIVLGIAGALLGTHYGVSRWRTPAFLQALVVVLWIASAKLILTGK
ncbi:MAG: sulfite exporter TauE/SafE family protein [Verrucomicrobiae bacterium]|nr:sulfite exporter TauE/SafE family protein [Verrucomicrobiae bacterium]